MENGVIRCEVTASGVRARMNLWGPRRFSNSREM